MKNQIALTASIEQNILFFSKEWLWCAILRIYSGHGEGYVICSNQRQGTCTSSLAPRRHSFIVYSDCTYLKGCALNLLVKNFQQASCLCLFQLLVITFFVSLRLQYIAMLVLVSFLLLFNFVCLFSLSLTLS